MFRDRVTSPEPALASLATARRSPSSPHSPLLLSPRPQTRSRIHADRSCFSSATPLRADSTHLRRRSQHGIIQHVRPPATRRPRPSFTCDPQGAALLLHALKSPVEGIHRWHRLFERSPQSFFSPFYSVAPQLPRINNPTRRSATPAARKRTSRSA